MKNRKNKGKNIKFVSPPLVNNQQANERRIIMKSILALILSATLLAFTADSIAGEWGYFANDKEELYGAWINTDDKSLAAKKLIRKPDGTFEVFTSVNIEKPNYKGRYLITGKWTDSDNNIWYKVHWVGDWREEGYTLHKLSNSGETLESVTDTKYPTEIDPKNNLYRKYTHE
jgi:hypothetical protein